MAEDEERSRTLNEMKAWTCGDPDSPVQRRAAYVRLLDIVGRLVDLETVERKTFPAHEDGGEPLEVHLESEAAEALRHIGDALRRLDQGIVEPILRPTRDAGTSRAPLSLEEERFRDAVVEGYRILRQRDEGPSAEAVRRNMAQRLGIESSKKIQDWVKRHHKRKNYD